MINGAFTNVSVMGNFLFLKRESDGLWDMPGGGYDIKETDYRFVAQRELFEESGIKCKNKEDLTLCAILGQRLKVSDSRKYGGVEHGYIFLLSLTLYEEPDIILSNEHTEYRFFEYKEIIERYKDFKSGPLWLFFTFLEYQKTNKIQEGLLYERRIWQGRDYL